MEISKVITHERWVLTSFLRWGSLAQILVNFFVIFGITDI
jgi:hypothetical protein